MASVDNGNYISDMVVTIPDGTDFVSTLDDSIREVKKEVKQTFPNLNKQTLISSDELNNLKDKWAYSTNQWSAVNCSIVNVSSVDNASAVQPRSYNDTRYAMLSKNLSDIPDKSAAVNNLFGALTPGSAGANAIVNLVGGILYPRGTLYSNGSVSTNPRTLFGFGTWAVYAPGRVVVSAGTGTDTRGESRAFAGGATGGEYNHALTIAELAPHSHPSGSIVTTTAGVGRSVNPGPSGEYGPYATGTAGSGVAHNNIQPYQVAWIWIRTA
ncbi:hypothetical protein OGY35_23830 [Citrobacter sp. Ct235]|uniref:phage baseplate protein n=1 Tax=Citrobacter sp. Ct235 TaxID=2985157 RepID=UPI0025756BFB|nr:hypothetical protein [Citrobacter sp. Ct235]MDM2738386.1 hypothetical protein [Citrobacter sp. Ct235]